MWSVGRYDLHLTDDEFWRLTFKEWAALIKRYNLQYERDCSHAALICYVSARVAGAKNVKFEDFMPKKKANKAKPGPAQSDLEMRDLCRMLNKAMGGREKPPKKG